MTTNLTPELQKQIEREADRRAVGFETKLLASVAKTEYEIGAEIYAEKWQSDISGGFKITKTGAFLVDAITVHPCCANEIRIN